MCCVQWWLSVAYSTKRNQTLQYKITINARYFYKELGGEETLGLIGLCLLGREPAFVLGGYSCVKASGWTSTM
jgi:hypothetical protein